MCSTARRTRRGSILGSSICGRSASTCASTARSRVSLWTAIASPASRRPTGTVDRRLLRRRVAGGDHADVGRPAVAPAGAAAGRARSPRDPVDERRAVLPRQGRPGRPRSHDLHRLGVGPDVDLAGPVLARRRRRALRRRERSRDPLRRRVRLGDARDGARARWRRVAAARRSAPRCGASSPITSTTGRNRCWTSRGCVPGSSIRRSSSRTRREATNLEPLLINTAGSWSDRPEATTRIAEPDAGRGLRADDHRPGDDGGCQRGGAPRRQRDPRRDRLVCFSLRAVRSGRAGGPAPRPPSRPRCAGGCSVAPPAHRCASMPTVPCNRAACSDVLPSRWPRAVETKQRSSQQCDRRDLARADVRANPNVGAVVPV